MAHPRTPRTAGSRARAPTASGGFRSPPAGRSEPLPTRPFAAAFARLSLTILLLATAYAHLLWRLREFVATVIVSRRTGVIPPLFFESIYDSYPLLNPELGPIETHLRAIWTVLTLRPVLAIFLVAGVVTLALELCYRR